MKTLSVASSLILLCVGRRSTLVRATGSSSSSSLLSQKPGTAKLYDFDHAGVLRHYKLYLPKTSSSLSTFSPVVFLFHGWAGNENDFLSYDSVRAASDAAGYVLIAPRGLGSGPPDKSLNSWTFLSSSTGVDSKDGGICDVSKQHNNNYNSCVEKGVALNLCAWTQCQDDDVAFVLALLSSLMQSSLSLDASNVFAMGGSNGGMFTWWLGQNPLSAGSFQAIAPLIGVPHANNLEAFGREVTLPVLVVTGVQDTTVPPGEWDNWMEGDDKSSTTTSDGDFYYYSGASAITRKWAEKASTVGSCEIVGDNALAFNEGRTADCRSFCKTEKGEWPVVLDCRYNMGHDYDTDETFPLIMDFFKYHENKGAPSDAPTAPPVSMTTTMKPVSLTSTKSPMKAKATKNPVGTKATKNPIGAKTEKM